MKKRAAELEAYAQSTTHLLVVDPNNKTYQAIVRGARRAADEAAADARIERLAETAARATTDQLILAFACGALFGALAAKFLT